MGSQVAWDVSYCVAMLAYFLDAVFMDASIGTMPLLTHLPLVPHICVRQYGKHWFRLWPVAYLAPSHYLHQWWVIVNWILRNTLQWNFNQNTKLIIHENAFENIVCEVAAILSRGRWVYRDWSAWRFIINVLLEFATPSIAHLDIWYLSCLLLSHTPCGW